MKKPFSAHLVPDLISSDKFLPVGIYIKIPNSSIFKKGTQGLGIRRTLKHLNYQTIVLIHKSTCSYLFFISFVFHQTFAEDVCNVVPKGINGLLPEPESLSPGQGPLVRAKKGPLIGKVKRE